MSKRSARTILITGGAGFIGSNLAERLLAAPDTRVRLFDDLSRQGVVHNLDWLRSLPGSSRLEFIQGDIRRAVEVNAAAQGATEIYHLAAQVAVTTSVDQPRPDFEINVGGTFNVLEAARRQTSKPFLLFTSTNKVYGSLYGVPCEVSGSRYRAADRRFVGVSETEPLDFHSPYGCSKGAADQYVRDYARIYGIPTVVFRMSCIAGPRQFGTEDQGWIAHFLYSALEGRPITVYGDGYQVRDVLHVHDLVDAIELAQLHSKHTAGEIYNLGGGPERAISITELLSSLSNKIGSDPMLRYGSVRPGDQPLYISNTAKFTEHTGWHARRSIPAILGDIHAFWRENQGLVSRERDATFGSHLGAASQLGSGVGTELLGEVA